MSRDRLVGAARSSDCRFVSITAPAGYGKTTLLAEWAHAEDRPVAWLTLDPLDDDPATLLVSLAAALRHAGLSRASTVPFVLMLDDVHRLQSPASRDVLGAVISGIPRGSQLAAASRSEGRYLPRLRAVGEALEFGAGELAVDAAAARQIFANVDLGLSAEHAAAVIDRTEGWPTGVYLAALIAKIKHDESLAIKGDDRYVADYLYHEVLLQQPEAVQRFLRRTAILEQLCGPACDAVLGSLTAAGLLRRLEDCSLFLIPLDRHRERYRYHALFREFLLSELRRSEPEIIVTLHQRAADWYESNGSPELAVEHLLNTPDWDRSMRQAAALAIPLYYSGNTTARRWFRSIGDQNIRRYPPLAVLRCYEAALTGDVAGAQRWAALVDAASFDSAIPYGASSFESARALLRSVLCRSGPEAMMADAAFAVGQELMGSRWRPGALWSLGEAKLLAGQHDDASSLLAEASATGAAGNPDAVIASDSELALLAMDRGDWKEAADRLERALATVDRSRMQNCVTSLLAFAAAARLAVHDGQLDEASNQLTRAMRARASATAAIPFVAVRLRLQLAKVYLSISDPATARQLVREIDDILIQRPALGALADEVEDFRRVLVTSTAPAAPGLPKLTPAELRLLPYLQTHLTADRIAERLFLSSHTVKTQVKSIYRKLGVSSRDDAVREATTIGLLGG